MNAVTTIDPKDARDIYGSVGLKVTPAGPVLGAEIAGVDLERPLSPELATAIRTALLQYKVIFFRGQNISHEAHVAFGRNFGDLEGHPVLPTVPGHPMILDLVGVDGIVWTDATIAGGRGADKWHTDVTFREAPSMGGILRARVLPALGGDTLFCDTAALWRDLPDRMKDRLADLTAEHDILQSFGGRVSDQQREELTRTTPPVAHPVVRSHPETGEKALYVNRTFTSRILGVDEGESRELLRYLTNRVKQPEYQVRFQWSPHAIAFWDNRATQHYAVLDYWPHHRVMERVTVVGERPY
ncbi:MAG TPA: TauD/TfdA family dioxygenase [Caulobacteraceae bacterium]|nr:TauD/TfdA family dioxygenase [Caulobacteraceae bacterium]